MVKKAYSEVAEANAVVVTEADLVVVAVMREGGTEGDPEEEFSVVAGADSEVCSEVASGAVARAEEAEPLRNSSLGLPLDEETFQIGSS